MEYAAAKKWLFSSSGRLSHGPPCERRLITPTVSGQYSQSASTVFRTLRPVSYLTYRIRSGMQSISLPSMSWTPTFNQMPAISIRLPGRSLARPSILDAKTHLSNGSSLGGIRRWPHPILIHALSTSFLPGATLSINIRNPWISQANLFPRNHQALPRRKHNPLCSVYLRRI